MATSTQLRGFFLALGLGAVALAGYLLYERYPQTTADEPTAADGQQAGADKPADTPAAPPSEPAIADALPVELDIVRVEPDGSMVIAGRAGPDNTVDILLDDELARTVTANADGEFATELEGPLSNGTHTLSFIARNAAGVGITGTQTVAIEIPGDGKSPLVVIQDENKPPQIVQAPEPDQPASGGDGGSQVASAPPSDQPAGDSAASAEEPKVYIRAFEVSPADDSGMNEISLVGEAPTGAVLRVYVDDEHAGDTEADDNGNWTLKVSRALAPGRHSVRADMLGEDAKVIARAQVQFDRVELVAKDEPSEPAGGGSVNLASVPPDQAGQPAASDTPPAAGEPAAPADSGDGGSNAAAAPPPAPTMPGTDGTGSDGSASNGTASADAPAAGGDAPAASEPAAPADSGGTNVASAPSGDGGSSGNAAGGASGNGATPAKTPRIEIERGDALWRIARKVYGRGIEYTLIFEANKNQIDNPDLIFPGQVFTIPVVEGEQN